MRQPPLLLVFALWGSVVVVGCAGASREQAPKAASVEHGSVNQASATPEPGSPPRQALRADEEPPRTRVPARASGTVESQAEPVGPRAPVASSGPSTSELCAAWCSRISKQCSEKSGRSCKAYCPNYETIADSCRAEVRDALACAVTAKDLICAAVPPESCVQSFQSMTACVEGIDHPANAAGPSLPSGWERVKDEQVGFSIALPKGAKMSEAKGGRFWTVTTDQGITYYAGRLDAPTYPVADKKLLFSVLDFMGCREDYKLHGRIEKNAHVAVRFDSVCKDGSEWHGIWRVDGRGSFPLAFKAPPGKKGVYDEFFYSFEPL